jgi:hypothetical protein
MLTVPDPPFLNKRMSAPENKVYTSFCQAYDVEVSTVPHPAYDVEVLTVPHPALVDKVVQYLKSKQSPDEHLVPVGTVAFLVSSLRVNTLPCCARRNF